MQPDEHPTPGPLAESDQREVRRLATTSAAPAEPGKAHKLRRLAERADAEMRLRDGHAFVIVVGAVGGARASAVADLVDELARQRWLRRISVDLTCSVVTDRGGVAIVDALRAGAAPFIDVTTSGLLGRLRTHRHVA